MKVTADQIKQRLSEVCCLLGFYYNGVNYCVEPYSKNEFELLSPDTSLTVDSVDKVMEVPFFAGKCLQDIVSDIEIIEGL